MVDALVWLALAGLAVLVALAAAVARVEAWMARTEERRRTRERMDRILRRQEWERRIRHAGPIGSKTRG